MLRTSGAVARELQVPYATLFNWVRDRRIPPPEKDSSGRYAWTPGDVENARRILKTLRPQPAGA